MRSVVAHTTPYAWPWDGQLDGSRLALLVVHPRPASGAAPAPVPGRVAAVAGAVREAGGVVLLVRTTPPDRSAGLPTEPVVTADLVVDAYGVDGFHGSPLDGVLRAGGRDQLLLTGAWLETNVHSTMRSANDRGYECLLVLDACAAYDPGLRDAARSQIELSGGIFGAVGTSDPVRSALLPERTHA